MLWEHFVSGEGRVCLRKYALLYNNTLTLVNKQLLAILLVAYFGKYNFFCLIEVLIEYPILNIKLTLLLMHTHHSWMQQVYTSCLGIVKKHLGKCRKSLKENLMACI